MREDTHEETIYIAVVDGKVSHVYAERPLKYRVVAWETEPEPSIRVSAEIRSSTSKDKLVNELFHLVEEHPFDDELLHGAGEHAPKTLKGRRP